MSVTVVTQAELDAALAAGEPDIVIKSPVGVWLRVGGTAKCKVRSCRVVEEVDAGGEPLEVKP